MVSPELFPQEINEQYFAGESDALLDAFEDHITEGTAMPVYDQEDTEVLLELCSELFEAYDLDIRADLEIPEQYADDETVQRLFQARDDILFVEPEATAEVDEDDVTKQVYLFLSGERPWNNPNPEDAVTVFSSLEAFGQQHLVDIANPEAMEAQSRLDPEQFNRVCFVRNWVMAALEDQSYDDDPNESMEDLTEELLDEDVSAYDVAHFEETGMLPDENLFERQSTEYNSFEFGITGSDEDPNWNSFDDEATETY